MIRVAITDDHQIVLTSLANLLEQENDVVIQAIYSSAAATRNGLKDELPDVLLLDIHLQDGNGVDLCAEFHAAYPDLMIIALTTYNQAGMVRKFMKNGGAGYLIKSTSKEELLNAIHCAARGENYLHAEVRALLLNDTIGQQPPASYIPVLTRREQEVLQLIVDEKTTPEIADELCVSPKTVETHRMHLMQKLGVKNLAGLVKEAIYKGLLD